jgi:hypothetical protein
MHRNNLAWTILLAAGAATAGCRVEAPAVAPRVVELYTSEGCDSCPPADRWLSGLRTGGDVLAVAFHVDYWDRLGWRDRFADPRYTQRQAALQSARGARFSYTPQVVVDGRDWRGWPDLPPARSVPAPVRLTLQRDGEQVHWNAEALPGAPARMALWWVVLEDGHRSDVRAGENAGVTLMHDHVVRGYGTVPAWTGSAGAAFDAPSRGEKGRATRTIVVVTDAAGVLPLQATQIACGG